MKIEIFNKYKEIQNIAKQVIAEIEEFIKVDMTEIAIANKATQMLYKKGVTHSWYHNIMVFVFVGDRTVISASGSEYKPTNEAIKENDIVTIDLHPAKGNIWGDYARTFVIGNGKIIMNKGMNVLHELHENLIEIAKPEMTFNELFNIMNDQIIKHCFINLDFKGNLGHTFEKQRKERKFIERGNHLKLNQTDFFTFEPHICQMSSKYGYKMENVYYFVNNKLKEL